MIEDAHMQEIEDFLAERLSPGESARFRERADHDAFLAREVEMFRDLVEGVSRQGRSETRGRLQRLEASLRAAEEPAQPGAGPAKGHPLLKWGEVAAVVVIGVCAYALLSRPSSGEEL